MKVGTESQTGRDNVEGEADKNEFAPRFKFWPNQPQKGGSPLLLQIFSLRKRKMLLNWVLKKVILMARDLGKGGHRCKSIFREERRHLKPQKSAKPGLLEKF